jgi:hypothetical protein
VVVPKSIYSNNKAFTEAFSSELEVPEVDPGVFLTVMEHIYTDITDESMITEDTALDVLQLANQVQV